MAAWGGTASPKSHGRTWLGGWQIPHWWLSQDSGTGFLSIFLRDSGKTLAEFCRSFDNLQGMERYRWSEGECSGALFYSFASLLDLLYFILRSWSRLVVSCLVLHSLHLSSFALEILPKWYILSHIIPMCGIQLCLVHLVLATGGFEVLASSSTCSEAVMEVLSVGWTDSFQLPQRWDRLQRPQLSSGWQR